MDRLPASLVLSFSLSCTAPDVQVVPTVSVGKRLDEGVDTGAVYGSLGVSFVPAVPSTAYLPRARYDLPPAWTETPPSWWTTPPAPAPRGELAPGHTDADHHPTHDHPPDPAAGPEDPRTPWELITTLITTLALVVLEANRRTLRVGLKERPAPEE